MNRQEELQQMTDDELDVQVALAQGWTLRYNVGGDRYWGDNDDGESLFIEAYDYRPTQPTIEGKAQAWDLMEACNLYPKQSELGLSIVYIPQIMDAIYIKGRSLQVAVVMGSIIMLENK